MGGRIGDRRADRPAKPPATSFARFRLKGAGALRLFFFGARMPFSAVGMLVRRRDLWRSAATMIAGNAAALPSALILAWFIAPWLTGWIWPRPEDAVLSFFWLMFAVAMFGFCSLAGFFAALVVIRLILTRWLERLSIAVERDWLAIESGPASLRDWLPSWRAVIAPLIGRLIRFVFYSLPILTLNLIPVIGSIAAVIGEFVLAGLFLAATGMDFPTGRRDYRRRDRAALFRRCFPAFLGLGVASQALLLVPVFNMLFWLPTLVLSGTMTYMALEERELTPLTAPERRLTERRAVERRIGERRLTERRAVERRIGERRTEAPPVDPQPPQT